MATPRKGFALVLLCLTQLMVLLDLSVVNVALPSMGHDLGFSPEGLQWVLSGYALTFGGFLILGGRAGDLWGRRRVFLCGLVFFALSSLFGGLAVTPWMLVTARLAQGLSAAFLTPTGLSLATTIFSEEEERSRALSAFAAMAATGFALGMILGGLITEYLGWRWVMFINVPMALAVLLPAPMLLSESRDEGAGRALDLPGAVTATSALAALIYGFSEAPNNEWLSPVTLGLLALGALLLTAFVVIERRSGAPLVPLDVFRARPVAVSNAALMLKSTVGASWLFVLTLYFQEVLGYSALKTGLSFLPMGFGAVAAALFAPRLVRMTGGIKPAAIVGLALLAAGLLLLSRMSADGGLMIVFFGMVVGAVGYLFSDVPMAVAVTGGLSADRQGLAAGLLNSSAQLGSAWGVGVVAAVVAAATAALGGEAAGAEAMVGGFRWGLLTGLAFVVASLLLILALLPGEASRKAPTI